MDEAIAIAQIKVGNVAGLRALVEMYQAEAVQAAYLITGDRAAAEDVVQTAFLRAFERIDRFESSRPFRPWFLRVVVNDALKVAARQKRHISLEGEQHAEYQALVQRLDTTRREPEEAIQRKELAEKVRQALDRLSPRQRAAVVMHYFLGLSTAEMADQLKCASGTVRWHLSAARERLRILLASLR